MRESEHIRSYTVAKKIAFSIRREMFPSYGGDFLMRQLISAPPVASPMPVSSSFLHSTPVSNNLLSAILALDPQSRIAIAQPASLWCRNDDVLATDSVNSVAILANVLAQFYKSNTILDGTNVLRDYTNTTIQLLQLQLLLQQHKDAALNYCSNSLLMKTLEKSIESMMVSVSISSRKYLNLLSRILANH